jgi:hypothetical protein
VEEKNAQIGEQVFVVGVPVYQDGNGAPVEQVSPLGYHVGYAGILFLNVSMMVGTVCSERVSITSRWSRGELEQSPDTAHSGVDLASSGLCGPEHLVLGLWLD